MKLKYTRPIWYKYLRVQRKCGISWGAAFRVAILSFLFLFSNGLVMSSIADSNSFTETFFKAVCVLSIAPFYRRVEVYAKGYGLIILIIFGALGYSLGGILL